MEHAKLDSEALAEAWTAYKRDGDPEARNPLILHYTSLVRVVAMKIATQLPKMVDREDLISYGLFGLLDAIEKYDLDKNVKFETYAVTRIRGSIFDGLRGLDWVPRTVRAKSRDVERAEIELHTKLGRPPEDPEIATHLGIQLIDLWAIRSQANSGQIGAIHESSDRDGQFGAVHASELRALTDPIANPEDLVGTQEVSRLLAEAVDTLPQRSKTILVLYYLHEMTLAEIGEILGVTESRVCQLQGKLLQTLHEALAQGLVTAA